MRYLTVFLVIQLLCGQNTIMRVIRRTVVAAAAVGPVDIYTDLNGTTAGTTLTPTILNTGTRGNANQTGWGLTGSGITAAATQANCALGGTVQVDGTNYTVPHTSLSMSVDNSGTLRYVTASPVGSAGFTRMVAMTCVTINTGTLGGSGLWDLIRMNGNISGNVIAQFSTSKCAGSPGIDLETITSGTNNSSCTAVTVGNAYWLVLIWDSTGPNLCVGNTKPCASLSVYDSSFALVGSTLTAENPSGANGVVANVDFGQRESGTSTGVNKFENMMVRWSGGGPALTPNNTTQDPVYWVAQSHNNHGAGGTTTLATTKALEEHAGDVVVVTCSNENASGQTTSVTNTATETFTSAAAVKSAANGQSISQWVTFPSSGHTSQLYTCNFPSSAFSNIDVQILHGGTSYDTGAVGNKASGADSAAGAMTPSTATGTNVQCAYIQSAFAITSGTNYFLLNTSSSNSMGCQLRTNAPNSSQTPTMIHSDTNASMTTVGNYKP